LNKQVLINVFFNINHNFSLFLWDNMMETRKIYSNFAPNIEVDDTYYIIKKEKLT